MSELGKIRKGHCPRCGPDTSAHIMGAAVRYDEDAVADVTWKGQYFLLQCCGCQRVFQQVLEDCSEWDGTEVSHWPAPHKRKRPDWLYSLSYSNHEFYELVSSLYAGLDNDLTQLVTGGIRTAFDTATELLRIDPELPLPRKIEALRAQGRIGDNEAEDLRGLVEAGNAAMHRGWKATPETLDTLMLTLERFLHTSFVLNQQTAGLREKVPPRHKKD